MVWCLKHVGGRRERALEGDPPITTFHPEILRVLLHFLLLPHSLSPSIPEVMQLEELRARYIANNCLLSYWESYWVTGIVPMVVNRSLGQKRECCARTFYNWRVAASQKLSDHFYLHNEARIFIKKFLFGKKLDNIYQILYAAPRI